MLEKIEKLDKPSPLNIFIAFGGFFAILLLTFKLLNTELFRGDPDQGGQATPLRNEKTQYAHNFCARHAARAQGVSEPSAVNVSEDYTAWDLGFNRYLVKSAMDGASAQYVCKIVYRGGSDAEPKNWAVQSVEFLQ